MVIKPNEGESMVDAMLRQAKEQVAADHSMDAKIVTPSNGGLKKIEKVAKKASKSPSKKAPIPASTLGGDPNAGQPTLADIYSAIHVYRRAGESDGKLQWNANHEREMNGPGTLVFMHYHSFGEACIGTCKVKVEAE